MPKFGRNSWGAALERAAVGRPPKWMVEETEFEQVLRRAGGNRAMVRTWVTQNHTRRYVPETVLAEMGILHGKGRDMGKETKEFKAQVAAACAMPGFDSRVAVEVRDFFWTKIMGKSEEYNGTMQLHNEQVMEAFRRGERSMLGKLHTEKNAPFAGT